MAHSTLPGASKSKACPPIRLPRNLQHASSRPHPPTSPVDSSSIMIDSDSCPPVPTEVASDEEAKKTAVPEASDPPDADTFAARGQKQPPTPPAPPVRRQPLKNKWTIRKVPHAEQIHVRNPHSEKPIKDRLLAIFWDAKENAASREPKRRKRKRKQS